MIERGVPVMSKEFKVGGDQTQFLDPNGNH